MYRWRTQLYDRNEMRRLKIERNYVRNEYASYGRCLCAQSEMWDRLLRVVSFRCHSHIGANSVSTAHTRAHQIMHAFKRLESRFASSHAWNTHRFKQIRARIEWEAKWTPKERRKNGEKKRRCVRRAVVDMHFRAKRKRDKMYRNKFFRAAATLMRPFLTVWHIVKHADPIIFCFVVCWFGFVRCGIKIFLFQRR